MADPTEPPPEPSIGLNDAYAVETPDDNVALYRRWASSYESDFMAETGYLYHERVADYFEQVAERGDGPVLDAGCGTGVVGVAVSARGGWAIDGIDISPDMLARAAEKRNAAGEPLFGSLHQADLTEPLPIPDDTYGSVVSAGVFTTGHVGPRAVNELVRVVRPGGPLVLGVNSRFYAASGFAQHLEEMVGFELVEIIGVEVVPIYDGDTHEHSDDTAHLVALRAR
ncbi:MAG: class I SAM-dependent methyltransferase [Actinomycetota bacterium]